MDTTASRPLLTLATLALGLTLTAPARAALLAYEGFPTGAGAYSATGGFQAPPDGDALIHRADTSQDTPTTGQNVPAVGFTGPWARKDGAPFQNGLAPTVYPRVEASQSLAYYGAHSPAGVQLLDSTPGQVNFFRDPASSTVQLKNFKRDLAIGASSTWGSSDLFISFMVSAPEMSTTPLSAADTAWGFRSSSFQLSDPNNSRRFGFNVRADGSALFFGSQSSGELQTTLPAGTIGPAAGQFLVVMRLSEGPSSPNNDVLSLWVNPSDLSSEAANPSLIDFTSPTTNFFVTNNSGWSLLDAIFAAQPTAGTSYIFDEFRLGTTWADVLPFQIVPEPTRPLLLTLALTPLLLRRRRR